MRTATASYYTSLEPLNNEKQPLLLLQYGTVQAAAAAASPDELEGKRERDDGGIVTTEGGSRRYSNWKWLIHTLLGFAAGIIATQAWSWLVATALSRPVITDLAAELPTQRPSLSSLGRTVHLDGNYYWVPGKPKAAFAVPVASSAWSAGSLFPLTVIPSAEQSLTSLHIANVKASYAANDDVWTPSFMDNVLLSYTGSDATAFVESSTLSSHNSTFILGGYKSKKRYLHPSKAITLPTFSASDLPSGPYFASVNAGTVSVYEAWRLYGDTERAFHYGLVPDGKNMDAYQTLSASLPDSAGVAAIGVPSRLYYTKTDEKPLAGVRVSVKDLYNVKGLKTGMGSRAWLSLYPAATATAPCIQRLIDLGAVIVGKTRLSQFANGQYGTSDNVDYGVPFSVRGDNYQDPSSSSSGTGAAASAYGFIDLHIGSDTGGSVRAPAGVNGVYGNRPSQGAVDLTGVLPFSPEMDTSAYVTLDPYDFARFGKAYYGGNATLRSYPSFPDKFLYLVNPPTPFNIHSPGFFPSHNPAADVIYEAFVRGLEQLLGTKRTPLDFVSLFESKFGMLPADYVGPAWSLLTAYDQYNLVGKHFIQDYKYAHDGDHPFLDPPVKFNWEYGKTLTKEDREFYLGRKEDFQKFVASELMDKNSTTSCSNALTIFPLHDGVPYYKSDYHEEPNEVYNGWNKYSISQLGQVPEVVLPIGQVPYISKITGTTKYLPVSISIQAASGCDFVLYDLVTALADAGLLRAASAGTSKTFT